MAMIPVTVEQRNEADAEEMRARLEAFAQDITDRLNGQLKDAMGEVTQQVATLAAGFERPNAILH